MKTIPSAFGAATGRLLLTWCLIALPLTICSASSEAQQHNGIDVSSKTHPQSALWTDSNTIPELTDDSFASVMNEADALHAVVAKTDPQVVPATWFIMFYAPWCGHCQKVKPEFINASHIVEAESEKNADNVKRAEAGQEKVRLGARFALVDATVHKSVASAFGVTSFPTFAYVIQKKVYIYDGGRTQENFVFVSRYLYFGQRLTFINTFDSVAQIRKVMSDKPLRVPILFFRGEKGKVVEKKPSSAASTVTTFSPTPALNEIVFATLSEGHTSYFAWPFPIPMDGSQHARYGVSTPADATFVKKVEAAFHAASRGPQGEAVAVVSDEAEFGGVVPFKGTWILGSPPLFARKAISGAPDAAPEQQQQEQQAQESNAAAGEGDQQEAAAPAPISPVKRLRQAFISHTCPKSAAAFVEDHSYFAVEMVSADNFAPLANKKRLVIAAVGGVETRQLADDRTTRQLAAERTLYQAVQRRRLRLGAGSPFGNFRFVIVDSTLFTAILEEWLGGAVFSTGGSHLFVYDHGAEMKYVNETLFAPLIARTWATVTSKLPAGSDASAAYVEAEKDLLDTLDTFLRDIESGAVAGQPTNLLGRIARWIPFHEDIKAYFSIDDQTLTVVAGCGVFAVLIVVLALRPYPQQGSGPTAEQRRREQAEAQRYWDGLTEEQKQEYLRQRKQYLQSKQQPADKKTS